MQNTLSSPAARQTLLPMSLIEALMSPITPLVRVVFGITRLLPQIGAQIRIAVCIQNTCHLFGDWLLTWVECDWAIISSFVELTLRKHRQCYHLGYIRFSFCYIPFYSLVPSFIYIKPQHVNNWVVSMICRSPEGWQLKSENFLTTYINNPKSYKPSPTGCKSLRILTWNLLCCVINSIKKNKQYIFVNIPVAIISRDELPQAV